MPKTAEDKFFEKNNWLSIIVFSGLFIWIFINVTFSQSLAWLTDQILQATEYSWPPILWPAISIIQGMLIIVPSFLLAWFWPNPRYRSIFKFWTVAALVAIVYAPVRLISLPAVLAANSVQILVTLFLIAAFLGLVLFGRMSMPKFKFSRSSLFALTVAGLISYPWLVWGAFGSILDTVVNLLAGLLFGIFTGLFLVYFLFQSLRQNSRDSGANIFLGGLAGGIGLLVLAAGFGYGGLQLVLMLMIPPLGWLAAMIFEWFDGDSARIKWLPASLLFGIATAMPMMMVDPDEFSLELSLSSREQLSWSLYAALASMIIALTLCLILALTRNWFGASTSRRPFALSMIMVWIGAGLIYFFLGQPGFFGDQLFVVLSDQTDVSEIQSIENFDTRRQLVYDSLIEKANNSQAGLRNQMDSLGINYRPYYLVNALAVEGGPMIRFWLESRPEVDRVLDNPVLRPLPEQADISIGLQGAPVGVPWNLKLIGANRVWKELGVTGEGIVVGQSDSGVQKDHPELADSYRGREGDDFNWYDPWNHTASPVDISGHGTHTLGSIVGKNTGVAPGASWFACTNLARNLANPALYLDCLQFMLAPFPLGGDPFVDGDPGQSAHVINNSWGCPVQEGCDTGALMEAVRALRAAGIFIVASAGNDGPGCETVQHPLALYEEVFSVGAIDRGGNLASFSSRGPVTADGSGRLKPDLVAPGVDILSSFPDNTYEILPGTSMAGPHVAGVVALIWSANPSLIGNIDQTEEILRNSARSYDGSLQQCASDSDSPNNSVGYGILDAYAAVKLALEWTQS